MKLKTRLLILFAACIAIPTAVVAIMFRMGRVFLFYRIDEFDPGVRTIMEQMMVIAIVVLVFVCGALTIWIYRSVLRPLDKLQDATRKIRDGDLDFTLEADSDDDEIGQLCQDFEEMRIRLKENSEEKLRDEVESKELIGNISHDLKTPITAIKGYVEGILDGVADSPEKVDRYIRTIYNKANDMDRLIDELTFYSKIDTNRVPYNMVKLNVNDYFGDCAEEVGLDLESRGIVFTYENNVRDDVRIIADPEQMKRIINNIIGNSIKYLDKPQGRIGLKVDDAGDFVQICIDDNGRGIAADDLPYIFDRFYRTDSSRNSAKGGSGIGLSIVKKIIEDHGGRIWAVSTEGEGTKMQFILRKYQEELNDEQDSDH